MDWVGAIPRVLWCYPALSALAWLIFALPGGATFEGNGAFWWPVLTTVVFVLVARRHYVIWSLVVTGHVLLVLWLIAFTAGLDADTAGLLVLNAAAVVVLLQRAVRRFELDGRQLSRPGS